MKATITLHGHVSSKKNLLRRKRNGGMYRDAEVKAAIDALTAQARNAWHGKEPLEHPNMTVRFYVRDFRGDRDNKLTCLLDVLQDAGVIVNDSCAHFNGELLLLPAVRTSAQHERVVLELEA